MYQRECERRRAVTKEQQRLNASVRAPTRSYGTGLFESTTCYEVLDVCVSCAQALARSL